MRSLFVTLGFAVIGALPLVAAPSVGSHFEDGTVEGWGLFAGGDPSSIISWSSSAANPAHIRLKEGAVGRKDFFQAPVKFTGDKAGYYGGTLSFDLMVSSTVTPTTWRDDVVLIGANNIRLIHTFGIRPGLEWATFSISFDVGDWYFDTANHSGSADSAHWAWSLPGSPPRLATEEEIRSVLSDVSILLIKADFRAGDETVYLDNVVMAAPVPEPGSLAVALAGISLAALLRRGRKVNA